MTSDNKRAMVAFLAVCFFWGSTFLAMRIGVKDLPPFIFAGIRFVIAGGLMILFAKLRGDMFPRNSTDIVKISIVGLLMLLGGNGLVAYAVQWVHSGIASILIATVPLFMSMIEIFILRLKRIDYQLLAGLLLGFAGVAYLALGESSTAIIDMKGILVLLLASISWSWGSVYSKTLKTTGTMTAKVGIQMLAGGLGLLAVGAIMGEIPKAQLTPNSVWSILYLIVFGSLIGYSCYIYVLAKWSASKAATYAYVNPLVAVILGNLILNEPLSLSVIISMIIIISGVFLVQRAKVKDIKKELAN